MCSGAFSLGAAGLLDGRRCTTHWTDADELQRTYPRAQVIPDVLYVDDDPVITSAGSAAGLDACLHLVRKELGAEAANGIARRMVVPAHRDGGQAQFIERPLPDHAPEAMSAVLDWMAENIHQDVSVDQLAERAHMSSRTFARRFKAETGTTPHAWLTRLRINHAERLLEQTDEPIERVAELSGFGSATLLRHHFVKERSTTPRRIDGTSDSRPDVWRERPVRRSGASGCGASWRGARPQTNRPRPRRPGRSRAPTPGMAR